MAAKNGYDCTDSRYLRPMSTSDELWQAQRDAWGLDRLAWEDDEEGPPIDLDEPVDQSEDSRSPFGYRA
jgi:hypothetical protein